EHHVHLVDQAKAEVESLDGFQVDGDAQFAAIQTQKKVRVAPGEWRAPASAHIARAGFQLQDFGAIVREQERAKRSRERVRKVEDTDAIQRFHSPSVNRPALGKIVRIRTYQITSR